MKLGLLGHGVVGKGVTTILDKPENEEMKQYEVSRILVHRECGLSDARATMDINDILEDPEIEVVMECMGGLEPAHEYVRQALLKGKHVITSNKKMLAHFYEELMEIAVKNNLFLGYEATVGGGTPWIANLKAIRKMENILAFRGIFNGTTNYILDAMNRSGTSFADALEEAQIAGYAEQDPTDDVMGYDVRYKVMLTCMTTFDALVSEESIPTYGIANISKEDIAYAKQKNGIIKLVGHGSCTGGVSAYIMPMLVPDEDYLAHIPNNLNGLECTSPSLGKSAVIGQGAGSLPTAHAVVQDLIHPERNEAHRPLRKEENHIDGVSASYYIRTQAADTFPYAIKEKVNDHVIITERLPLKDVADWIAACGDDRLFIMELV